MNDTHFHSVVDIAPIRSVAHLTWSFTALIGIPANVFVLAAIVYFRDMRTVSNIYIFNLALADLLFLCGIPVSIFGTSTPGGWNLGPIVCKLYIAGNAVSQFASAIFIAILSFDRYLAVCRPIQSASWRTTRAAFVLSLAAWVMVIFEMTPLLLFVKLIYFNLGDGAEKRTCMIFVGNDTVVDFTVAISDSQLNTLESNVLLSRMLFTSYTFALSYLIPLVAVWFFYFKIILQMCRRKRQMYAKRTAAKRKTTKVTIMGLAIVVSYTHCWLPFWITQWAIELNLLAESPFFLICVSYFAYALQYLNSAANPFLYVFLSDSFQKNIAKLIRTAKPEKQLMLRSSSQVPSENSRMLNVTNNPMCSPSTLSTNSTC